MATPLTADRLMPVLRDTILGMVRRDGPDLSARQLSVFLIVNLEEGPHTVRGMAARLEVSKPAITRSVDRLVELGFAERGPDPRDRRSVLILGTAAGSKLFADIKEMLTAALAAPVAKARRGKG